MTPKINSKMFRIIMILLMFISNDPKIKPGLNFHFLGAFNIWKLQNMKKICMITIFIFS